MSLKCEVIKRFNDRDPGTKLTAPNHEVLKSWIALGLVKVVKETKAPKDKMIKESKTK